MLVAVRQQNNKAIGYLKINRINGEKYRNPHAQLKENMFLPLFNANFISKSFDGPLHNYVAKTQCVLYITTTPDLFYDFVSILLV
jgi:hypothetical protein